MRPYGVTVIPIYNHIPELLGKLNVEKTCDPSSAPIYCPNNEQTFHQLPHDIIAGKLLCFFPYFLFDLFFCVSLCVCVCMCVVSVCVLS